VGMEFGYERWKSCARGIECNVEYQCHLLPPEITHKPRLNWCYSGHFACITLPDQPSGTEGHEP